ncbi:MAG: hypothetical protein ABI175_15540 [Polyangiales bacterium]
MRGKDLLFWTIPAAVAVVAAVLGYRALRPEGPPGPDDGPPEHVSLICPPHVHRCVSGTVSVTTGEEEPGGEVPCQVQLVGRCAQKCVAEGIALVGVPDDVARTQLCDAPDDVEPLVASELGIAQLIEDGGGSCLADGFGPSTEGVLQCILESAKDPDALGIVVGRITCRAGTVATRDDTPRIVSRAQAIALWCRRDAATAPDATKEAAVDAAADSAGNTAVDAAGDGSLDGRD